MKKFTFLTLTVFILLSITVWGQQPAEFPRSQIRGATNSSNTVQKVERPHGLIEKCGTMKLLDEVLRDNPTLKQANELLLNQLQQNRGSQPGGEGNRLNSIVTIPIVFHIVLPNPYIVTDADIQAQVDRLNLDYSGLNPDSTNVPAEFQAVRGHSQLRFCLAQRTPAGLPTNGIERRTSATLYTGGGSDPIKSAAAGGLDAWDFTQYFNVWVGTGGGLLGYATFPGTSTAAQQGVVTDVIGTSSNPCYVDPSYNLGRTLTHEAGHYFGLYHIWGDDGGSCTNSDFRNLSGTCVISDATLAGGGTDQAIGDTPNQGDENFGCPSGAVTNACSANPPGDMFQNYMDYTDDACMTMFTAKQAARMEWIVANCRSGYITSQGCVPPSSGPNLDAAPVAVINPGGSEVGPSCSIISYGTPTCEGSLTPKFRITNNGLNTMTSVTVGSRLGTGPATTTTVTGLNLSAGQTAVVSAPAVTLVTGSNVLKLFTSDPNGITDPVTSNDTITTTITIAGPVSIPVSQNFDSPVASPWSIQTNGVPPVWQLAVPTGAPPSSGTNVTSAVIDHFNDDGNGKFDDIVSPTILTTGVPSMQIKFDVAYVPYSSSFSDTLIILISKDCGATYKQLYKKGGTTLATKSGFQTSAFTPASSAEWRTEFINVDPSDLASGSLYVVFRSKAGFGNRLWLDNINIGTVAPGNDASISSIITPATGSNIACSPITPVVRIQNNGSNTLTTATINVTVNGTPAGSQAWTGSLAQGSGENVTLNAITINTLGTNTIKVFTTAPNGQADAQPANDTATSVVNRIAPSVLPVLNDFETTLTPANWTVTNPNNDGLFWFRFNPGGGSAGGSVWAAVIDNYDFELRNTVDDIVTPVINTSTLQSYDSLYLTFDLAHKFFPATGFGDSLKVLVSNNCGATWTTIWAKGDPDLATAGSDLNLYNPPASSDWKKQTAAVGPGIFNSGQLQFAVRNVNGFGNVTWVDNINVARKPRKDMQTTAIVKPALTECTSPIAPSITVRNNGDEQVTGFKTGYILNNGTPVYQAQNILLNPGQSTTVTFSNLNVSTGNNTIKMFVADPLTGTYGPDVIPANDTLTRSFIVPVTAANVIEGFEGSTYVPSNWALINANNNVTWTRVMPGKLSDYSSFIDNYNNNTVGQLDILQAPPVNTAGADSVYIVFDVAHKYYDDGSFAAADRLRVLVSTNCGTSFTSVYSKSGPTLATAGSSDENYSDPIDTDWRRDTIKLGNTFTGGNLIAQFENRNDWGNNIFIDNINIIPKFKRDIQVLSVTPDVSCNTSYAPKATVYNRGTETVTGFTIAYKVGTGTAVSQNVTGISLAPGTSTTITLTAGTLAVGANTISIYTSSPVTASGTGDQYLVNDTIVRTSYATSTVSSPIVETFEGSFVPSGWAINNPDASATWQKASVGLNSNGSAFMRNYGYLAAGQRDALYTPVLSYTGVDSVKLSFDLSAATKVAAMGGVLMDTLEVLVTRDCGNTFTSVYKKWGTDLQTIYDNTPVATEYFPNAYYLWRKETIDLTSYAPDGPLQVVFRNSTNNQNNVFIDNVNVATRTLPDRLKADGYIITPNPFNEQFNIWYVSAPSDLRYVAVYNTAGQLIWNKAFSSGSTSNVITVDLTGKSAGLYMVKLGYSDKSKDELIRIMKSN